MKNSTLLEFETQSEAYLSRMATPNESVNGSFIEEEGSSLVTTVHETLNLPIDIDMLYKIHPYT